MFIMPRADSSNSLILGGGYGFLSSEHGLVIDNLLEVRLRLAPIHLVIDLFPI
jgi:hypothetical protein